MDAQILTVSSKGQISIPIDMRRSLSIATGDKLLAYFYGDMIMLKALKLPTREEFEESLMQAREWADSVGYDETDVNGIIKEFRKNKKK